MPTVRWRGPTVLVMAVFYLVIGYSDVSEGMQQPISMTADGWKPIIGSSRPPASHYQDEIKYYQNPTLKETVMAEPLATTTLATPAVTRLEPKAIQTVPISVNIIHQGNMKGKIPPHSKHTSQYFVLPNHGIHGPHIPLNAATLGRPGPPGMLKKGSIKSQHGYPNGKRIVKKPMIGQLLTAHSTRNEVYVPAPSQGSHSYYSPGKTVRTRESSGLGVLGQKLFSIKQPHAHTEFSSYFPPNNLYQVNPPVQHIIFQKQQINEIIPPYQVDTAQNIIPPTIFKTFADSNQNKHNQNSKINPEIRTPNDKVIFSHNPLGPNDLILQLPSYDQSVFGFGKQKIQGSVNEVTKDQGSHNDNILNLNQPSKELNQNFHIFRKPITDYPKPPTYEVTEGKWEDNTPPPNKFHRPNNVLDFNLPPFLPTPYKPVVPTSPTQNEVSTIFVELSNAVKHYPDTFKRNPYFFDVKEVSTHYPILGTPEIITAKLEHQEGITGKPLSKPIIEDLRTTTESIKQFVEKPSRNKSGHRRRRPTTKFTTTTQSSIEMENEKEENVREEFTTSTNISEELETERPYRPRRPTKVRPSSSNSGEQLPQVNRVRDRHRKRPYQNDLLKNHNRKRVKPNRFASEEDSYGKPTETISREQEVIDVLPIVQHFTTQGLRDFDIEQIDVTTIKPETHTQPITEQYDIPTRKIPHHIEDSSTEQKTPIPDDSSESEDQDVPYRKRPDYNREVSTSSYENESSNEEDTTPPNYESLKDFDQNKLSDTNQNNKRSKYQSATTTTDLPTTVTNFILPDHEVDFSTIKIPAVIHSFEHEENPKTTTTSEPTTTMLSTTSMKSHRRRPIKYNASSRPRFSVKDYRQRLNQYSTTSTTSESPKSSTENVRLRFPTRLRRPISTTLTTTQATEEVSTRSKFVPKEPRHSSPSSISNEIITEKNVKSVNTRLRPFGRTKSTTDHPMTTTKISIRPNLFSNRIRRPTPISLKTRIQNRNNNKISENSEVNNNDVTSVTNIQEISTVSNDNELSSTTEEQEEITESEIYSVTTSAPDSLKNEAFVYSQRVSDLTSSVKNDYEGFKSVPSNSRRIPNYYTISTEDPILPIEAFFSNISDRGK
ncbi:hypothetical protein HHI36_001495 [Cryptolaemus montrouzieri]|uniref:Uncharacterized protein n=1 Tax=Cryptolaemus montrouzieri TaxID=559131 RepID=A0ABD2P7U5_9CUCU